MTFVTLFACNKRQRHTQYVPSLIVTHATMTSRDVQEFDALISSFAETFGNAAVAELEGEREFELAFALRRVLDSSDVTAADHAVEHTYWALKTKNAWPSPAWRECYVLAQLRRCVELLRGGCFGIDAREAQRALDMTIIFGAPSEPLRGLMQAVESACFAGDDDARRTYVRSAPQSELLFPSEPPSTALGGQCLERVEGTAITVKEFKRRFYSTDMPVVLANLGKDWRALRVWDDLEWWRRFHGHRCVPLEIGRYSDVSDWREDVMTVDDFVEKFMAPSVREDAQNIAYLAQHPLIDQLVDLRRDFEIPALCAKSLLRINAWMGTAGTITPCHFDSYDNLLGQVRASEPSVFYSCVSQPYLGISKKPPCEDVTVAVIRIPYIKERQ